MKNNFWSNFLSTFFLRIPSKPGIYSFRGLRVYYYCPFLCETENEAAAILILEILINRSYFQLIALKPGIYRVTASAEGYLSACMVLLS